MKAYNERTILSVDITDIAPEFETYCKKYNLNKSWVARRSIGKYILEFSETKPHKDLANRLIQETDMLQADWIIKHTMKIAFFESNTKRNIRKVLIQFAKTPKRALPMIDAFIHKAKVLEDKTFGIELINLRDNITNKKKVKKATKETIDKFEPVVQESCFLMDKPK